MKDLSPAMVRYMWIAWAGDNGTAPMRSRHLEIEGARYSPRTVPALIARGLYAHSTVYPNVNLTDAGRAWIAGQIEQARMEASTLDNTPTMDDRREQILAWGRKVEASLEILGSVSAMAAHAEHGILLNAAQILSDRRWALNASTPYDSDAYDLNWYALMAMLTLLIGDRRMAEDVDDILIDSGTDGRVGSAIAYMQRVKAEAMRLDAEAAEWDSAYARAQTELDRDAAIDEHAARDMRSCVPPATPEAIAAHRADVAVMLANDPAYRLARGTY